jgi:hypothetical protein
MLLLRFVMVSDAVEFRYSWCTNLRNQYFVDIWAGWKVKQIRTWCLVHRVYAHLRQSKPAGRLPLFIYMFPSVVLCNPMFTAQVYTKSILKWELLVYTQLAYPRKKSTCIHVSFHGRTFQSHDQYARKIQTQFSWQSYYLHLRVLVLRVSLDL